jgi:hypothetical protein
VSKKAVVEVRENAQKRKNEYFVKGFDITESVEFLLAEVEKDYEFKKQLELQCGLHSCNDILNKQTEKYRKQVSDLEAKLAESENRNKKLKDEVCKSNVGIAHLKNQLKQAKQQLAEKEHELEEYHGWLDRYHLNPYQLGNLIEGYKITLAEKDEEIKVLKSKEKKIRLYTKRDWFERCCRLEDKSISLGLENIELKQQLAEKDAEIKNLVLAHFESDVNKPILTTTEMINQDKISFAVEQIMQIREKIDNSEKIGIGLTLDGSYEIDNIFDNQIKQLKEGK